MYKMPWKNVLALAGVCFCWSSLPLLAQEPGLAEVEPIGTEEVVTADGPSWTRVCSVEDDPYTCRIFLTLAVTRNVDGKQTAVGHLLRAEVFYSGDPGTSDRKVYMNLDLPLGVDLQAGAVIRVDLGAEVQLPYLQCTQAGCRLSMFVGDEFVSSMKLGNKLQVGFRSWGSEKLSVITASLIGFTSAFDSIQ